MAPAAGEPEGESEASAKPPPPGGRPKLVASGSDPDPNCGGLKSASADRGPAAAGLIRAAARASRGSDRPAVGTLETVPVEPSPAADEPVPTGEVVTGEVEIGLVPERL